MLYKKNCVVCYIKKKSRKFIYIKNLKRFNLYKNVLK